MSSPKQRHAVRERCNALKRSLVQFETTFLDESETTPEGRAERHEVVNQALEQILSQANHLRKALKHAAPDVLDEDLAGRIMHLRNIYEHWEQHRDAFLVEGAPIGRSGRWYAEHYPDRSPLSYEWSKTGGFRIAGIIELHELHELIDRARRSVDTPPTSAAVRP